MNEDSFTTATAENAAIDGIDKSQTLKREAFELVTKKKLNSNNFNHYKHD